MDKTTGEYDFTRLETVVFGVGKVDALGRELSRRGAKRALIVTGKTLGQSKLLDQVKSAAGSALAGVFAGAAQHVPSQTVTELVAEARRVNADAMVSFGGGSPIDTVKNAAWQLMRGGRAGSRTIDFVSAATTSGSGGEILHIAIPTTLSAGEFTPGGGVTDESTKVKGVVADPLLQARAVILDPALTVETPAWLWASTGMRALDHAVEGSYSTRHQLVTDTLASKAIALLNAHLLPSLQTHGDDELEHRMQCQLAAWLSNFGMSSNSRGGISHALGHQIGPMWNVPHGITSCITLPHVMRLMAGVAADRFAPIAQGFEVRFDPRSPRSSAMECADRTAKFIGKFDVPTRLRDVGVPREEISRIAGTVLEEVKRANTVGVEVTRGELVQLLEAGY